MYVFQSSSQNQLASYLEGRDDGQGRESRTMNIEAWVALVDKTVGLVDAVNCLEVGDFFLVKVVHYAAADQASEHGASAIGQIRQTQPDGCEMVLFCEQS